VPPSTFDILAGASPALAMDGWAGGHSREPIHLDPELDTARNVGSAANAAGTGCGRARSDEADFQPLMENPPYGMIRGGGGKEVDGLMTVCHDARKGRYIGSHWPNHVRASALLDQCNRKTSASAIAKSALGVPRESVVAPFFINCRFRILHRFRAPHNFHR